jgi:hypothetical protein
VKPGRNGGARLIFNGTDLYPLGHRIDRYYGVDLTVAPGRRQVGDEVDAPLIKWLCSFLSGV